MRIYVASSWRNDHQPEVVEALREEGYEVYDYKNPSSGGWPDAAPNGFGWREIDPDWKEWTPKQYRQALDHPAAMRGFRSDFDAMERSDLCVYVLPCGRSASLEAGFMAGQGKPVIVYQPVACEPELMVKLLAGPIFTDLDDLIWHINRIKEAGEMLANTEAAEGGVR